MEVPTHGRSCPARRAAACVLLLLIAAALSAGPGAVTLRGQGGPALTGVVRSAAEGRMEGVVVTARREGATFTVSVVSDAQGRYAFPHTHLEPGPYTP